MATDHKTKDEKSQYDSNRKATKISALSSGIIDKYEYLGGGEILSSVKSLIIEQANFMYPPLHKAFEKQAKTIEDQAIKQLEPLKVSKPEENKGDIKSVEGIFPKK